MEFEPGSINQKWIMLIITPFLRPAQFQSDLPKCQFKSDYLSHSAHRTTNFMNPEFQFPQFKVLQSVFFLSCAKSYIGIFDVLWPLALDARWALHVFGYFQDIY